MPAFLDRLTGKNKSQSVIQAVTAAPSAATPQAVQPGSAVEFLAKKKYEEALFKQRQDFIYKFNLNLFDDEEVPDPQNPNRTIKVKMTTPEDMDVNLLIAGQAGGELGERVPLISENLYGYDDYALRSTEAYYYMRLIEKRIYEAEHPKPPAVVSKAEIARLRGIYETYVRNYQTLAIGQNRIRTEHIVRSVARRHVDIQAVEVNPYPPEFLAMLLEQKKANYSKTM